MADVAAFERGSAMTERTTTSGNVPVVANGPAVVYFHNVSNRDGETLVVARSGAYAGTVSFWSGPIFLTDAFSIRPNSEVLRARFAFFALVARQHSIRSMRKGAGVPHVRVSDLEKFVIPVPSIAEQDRIVEILDKFDALVNDLSIGLPAELAARRKQYEYYRDRLLTFKAAA